jgi:Arc/MetJ-type ribon-helix-helix transcriptional regulator
MLDAKVTIRLPRKWKQRLEVEAHGRMISVNDVAREALRAWFSFQDTQTKMEKAVGK